jgi:low affinity Fe/Cu permease
MKPTLDSRFAHATSWVARQAGSPFAFAAAAILIIAWALAGPFLGYSDLWQLTINTATTVITFLMVFVIQNSQNRDAEALQIKIDELIRATLGAENALLDLENLPQGNLDEFREHYRKLAEHARVKGFDLAAIVALEEEEILQNKRMPAKTRRKEEPKTGHRHGTKGTSP